MYSPKNCQVSPPNYQLLQLMNEQGWIIQIKNLIRTSLPETKITVEDLAEAVHVSPRQLHRKVKALTGVSPVKLIQEIQLQLALEELEKGEILSLGDLAFKCGFEYQGYFSTIFKNRFGISPREYWKDSMKQAS
ncbi:MAG: helix-turn-helix transcriptional regulator [Bacteroidetes bacterium]|nr:helix-turn-helix transcriptional regulator [Bacteroidota bacterium]